MFIAGISFWVIHWSIVPGLTPRSVAILSTDAPLWFMQCTGCSFCCVRVDWFL